MKAQRKLVSFIGLGSGNATALLYSYLKFHPEILVLKETTNFFNDVKIHAQGIDWYESLFPRDKETKKCGELALTYLASAQASALIARVYPKAKLLAVIDNPLVSVQAIYLQAMESKKITSDMTLAMFIKQYPEVLSRYRYGHQLAKYFSFYSLSDILVVTATDITKDSLKIIAQVYEHFGLDKNFVPDILKHLIPVEEEDPKHRPGIIKRTYRAIKKNIKKTYNGILHKFKKPLIVPDRIVNEARLLKISPDLEEYLKDYYREDVILLSKLLRRDFLGEWGMEVER